MNHEFQRTREEKLDYEYEDDEFSKALCLDL
jgi:hypothetical protein